MRRKMTSIALASIVLMALSCRDEFDIESRGFEDVLVIEATLTDEFKFQTVKLSRTYPLNEEGPAFENGATVQVVDSNGNTYTFSQSDNGLYTSETEFQAVQDVSYELTITTADGNVYKSSAVTTSPKSEITNLYGELTTNNDGQIGIQVLLDSDNSNTSAIYFRYDYEETFKVKAPYYFPYEAILSNYSYDGIETDFDVDFVLRQHEEEICFTSKGFPGLLLASTNSLADNKVSRLPIRFINKNDGIIRDRYSILVKQYVQSIASYTYYSILKDLGNTESILSESQPGFAEGNMTDVNNTDTKVVGFFDVASVSEKRLYFNYFDFGLTQPAYLYECDLRVLDIRDPLDKATIFRLIDTFTDYNYNYQIAESIPGNTWTIASPECTDCTSISSNIRPDFWED